MAVNGDGVSQVFLGPIVLFGREVPDKIPFGGKQIIAVHQEIGGTRVIDAMGPAPMPISWSAHLYSHPQIGLYAADRARALDALRQSGAQVQLSWGSFSYLVVVQSFKAVYKNEWEIAYSITCCVVQDSIVAGIVAAVAPTLAASINNDLTALNLLTGSTAGLIT